MSLIKEIKCERCRQRNLLGRQKHSLRVWLWILLEEVGEYYQAKLEYAKAKIKFDKLNGFFPETAGVFVAAEMLKWDERKHEECVQVLAVIVAIVQEYRPWHGVWRVR